MEPESAGVTTTHQAPSPELQPKGTELAGELAVAAKPEPAAARSVVRRWRRKDAAARVSLLLRASACASSLLCAALVASDKHGGWKQFDWYDEYRFLLAAGLLAFLHSLAQIALGRGFVPRFGGAVSRKSAAVLEFAGDQVVAYLMLSASTAATSVTKRLREKKVNVFTDAAAAAVSMGFFAFACLSLSALISGLKLANQTYI